MLKIVCTLLFLLTFIKEIFMAYKNSPIIIEETPGIKIYCTSGESNNKPYCDGSHSSKATGKTPKELIVDETRRLAICDCGETGNAPMCDGTHSNT